MSNITISKENIGRPITLAKNYPLGKGLGVRPSGLTGGLGTPSISANAGDGQVILSWADVSGETSYLIHRSTSSGFTPSGTSAGSGTCIATESAGATGHTDSTVSNGTTYYYVVQAYDGSTTTSSSEVSAAPAAGASPFFSDDFESYAVDATLGGEGSNGFLWSAPHDGVYVTDEMSRAGTKCLKAEYAPAEPGNPGHTHWWAEQDFNLGRDLSEVWIEFYIYHLDGTEGLGAAWHRTDAAPTKMMTIWSPDGDGYNQAFYTFEYWGARDGTEHSYILLNRTDGDLSGRPGSGIALPTDALRGSWIRFRTHAKWASGPDANDGISQTWINDTLVEDLQNLDHWDSGASTSPLYRHGYLFGYDNENFGAYTAVYIDDFAVYDSDPGWEPFYEDDFESYTVGAFLDTEGDGSFAWGGHHDGTYVSDDIAYVGTQSLKFEYAPTEPGNPGHTHWWAEQNFNLGRNVTELWMEWYMYFPDGTEGIGSARYNHTNIDGSSDNNKFLALWADSYASEPLAIIELWQTGTGPNYGSMAIQARTEGNLDGDSDLVRRPSHNPPTTLNNGLIVTADAAADVGRWIQIRYHHKVSDIGASNGEFHLWKDGELVISIENDPFWDEAGTNNYTRNGYLMGYDNGRFDDFTAIYIDNIKFYDSYPGW